MNTDQRDCTEQTPKPSLRERLGWGHHGYHHRSQRRAVLILCLVLLLPCLGDQVAIQYRMRNFSPDLLGWLANAETIMADPAGWAARDPATSFCRTHTFYIYPPFFLTLIWPALFYGWDNNVHLRAATTAFGPDACMKP